ncbi:MAG: crossover junction endodeoxyribonuclease RuvC [Aquificaceae bacterium]|nr:MAG: crossover junction endodeoxyribonuclease RuvC [Aquificaceae bacterium]
MSIIRILGIDPGSRITGVGIIDSDGRHSKHVFSTCIRLGNAPFPERLGAIYRQLEEIIVEYQPQQMAIEDVFLAKNPASALKLGQARGAAICAAVMKNIPVSEYSAREIKLATVGKGNADKSQVQHMVKILLNLQGKIQADTADGLAIALSHAHTGALKARLEVAKRRY